jgi:ferredoxin-type protein NapG
MSDQPTPPPKLDPAPTPPPPRKKKKEPPVQRRGFFSEMFQSLAEPALELIDARFKLGLKDVRLHVRPPGSVPESEFVEKCRKTGYCVEACPVKALIPLPEYKGGKLAGTPVVVADTQPCILCYDLACMAACPTGAILPMGREQIRMGIARWNAKTCTRTTGDDCRICVEKCPLGDRVMKTTPDGKVSVNERTCTGCGVCTFYCPTNPKSITVDPNP